MNIKNIPTISNNPQLVETVHVETSPKKTSNPGIPETFRRIPNPDLGEFGCSSTRDLTVSLRMLDRRHIFSCEFSITIM